MVSRVLSGEPEDGSCRVCKTPLEPGSPRCSHCGAVHGERFRCPHCRAVADVEHLDDGRQRCKACGGPRLLLADGQVALSGAEREPLRQARRASVRAHLYKALGAGLGLLGGFALLAAAIVVALASPGVMLGTLALALASLPLLLGLGAWRRGLGFARERDRAQRAAELSAAKDLAQASAGELKAAELARALGIDETRAELLLAELSLEDHVARRVTETGELAYSARPRVRLDGAAPEPLETADESGAVPEQLRGRQEGS